MRRLRYTLSAQNDLDAIADYIEAESASAAAARSLIDRLQSHCERLAGLPGTLGQERSELRPGIRSKPDGNYVIFFRYEPGGIAVLAVVDARRDISALFDDRT